MKSNENAKNVKNSKPGEVDHPLLPKLTKDEVNEMHTNFILACGGELHESNIKDRKYSTKKEKVKKIDTKEVTHTLWNEGKDIYEIADARGLSHKTIWGHVEELVEESKITHPALKRLITPKIEKMIPEISKVFKKYEGVSPANFKMIGEEKFI